MTYKAIVSPLKNVRGHPNADRLLLATCFSDQIIISTEFKEGDIGLYFACDGQLSFEFASHNDLIRRKNEDGSHAGGFFEDSRRVRAQPFRGQKSYGFWIPLDSLKNIGATDEEIATLKIGDEIEVFHGVPICNKYETPATIRARLRGEIRRNETKMFKVHFETPQLKRMSYEIPSGALITIQEKLHGTSHRLGYVYEKEITKSKLKNIWFRILDNLKIERRKWQYIHGSRRMVLDDMFTDKYHGSEFRKEPTKIFEGQLKKGEVIYGEIVGYAGEKPIMNPHDVKKLGDKELVSKFGSTIIYNYSQPIGSAKFYVYRIALVNEDGYTVEYSWQKVKDRCEQIGVSHVPEIAPPFIYDGDSDKLIQYIESLSEGTSLLSQTHIREGVCVRIEHKGYDKIAKLKSWQFLKMESDMKDNSEVIDTEEIS